MKKNLMCLSAAVMILALLGFVSNVPAADANQPKEPPKEAPKEKQMVARGTVVETKDKDGNVTEVKLEVNKSVSYQITLDDKGKELGRKMAGKTVRVVGLLETKDGVKWLTVEKYNEAPPRPEAKPQPKSQQKPQSKPGKTK